MREEQLKKLEQTIRGKMAAIKRNELLPKDSGIGKLFTILKGVDLPLYESLLEEYKNNSKK
jgi:hypothetical protein